MLLQADDWQWIDDTFDYGQGSERKTEKPVF